MSSFFVFSLTCLTQVALRIAAVSANVYCATITIGDDVTDGNRDFDDASDNRSTQPQAG